MKSTIVPEQLGTASFDSPLRRRAADDRWVPYRLERESTTPPDDEACFEQAGPREKLYFTAVTARPAIVTCGGLCPGLNNVIRSTFMELYHRYAVRNILGIRYGYQGLNPANGYPPLQLDTATVENIQHHGGSILGTSRGPVPPNIALDYLEKLGVNILFCIGGDGTQRGAYRIHLEAKQRGYPLAVIGIPKTIDNDVPYVWRTFGYNTALEEARRVIDSAHNEARAVVNGVALVKLMGREAGFIAAGATLASQEVNLCLIPEIPFHLDTFLDVLARRLQSRQHAVVVVAEGAGQQLLGECAHELDASGNRKIQDIGPFLRDRIVEHFKSIGMPVGMKYIDPSYIIRSRPANTDDSLFCDQLARNAVHAAMAGRTGIVMGFWYNIFTHVPTSLITSARKSVDPHGELWQSVLSATGQPDLSHPPASGA